jgi:hypothetical protein
MLASAYVWILVKRWHANAHGSWTAHAIYLLSCSCWLQVSDFGLSLCVDPGETHVSSVHAGTLTNMAPELLMLLDYQAAAVDCRCLGLASACVSRSAATH